MTIVSPAAYCPPEAGALRVTPSGTDLTSLNDLTVSITAENGASPFPFSVCDIQGGVLLAAGVLHVEGHPLPLHKPAGDHPGLRPVGLPAVPDGVEIERRVGLQSIEELSNLAGIKKEDAEAKGPQQK